MAVFELCFSIRKEFLKKKVSGEIAFELISLFHVQIQSLQVGQQLPQEHLPFLRNLLNFIITKYLKQEVDDSLSLCMDEHSPCGLSITGDIKIYQCKVIKWRSALSTSITELLLLPKFDNSSPSVTQDKEICHVVMS